MPPKVCLFIPFFLNQQQCDFSSIFKKNDAFVHGRFAGGARFLTRGGDFGRRWVEYSLSAVFLTSHPTPSRTEAVVCQSPESVQQHDFLDWRPAG